MLGQERETGRWGFRPPRPAVLVATCLAVVIALSVAFWPGIAEGLMNLSLPGEHVVFSCAAGTPLDSDEVPPEAVQAAREHLRNQARMPIERMDLVGAELVTWGTASSQNPLLTAEGSSPIMLAGYRMELSAEGQRYRYYVKPILGGLKAVPAQECRTKR